MNKENFLLYQLVCQKINSPLKDQAYIKKLMKEVDAERFISIMQENKCIPIIYEYKEEFGELIREKIKIEYEKFVKKINALQKAAIEIASYAEKEKITIIEPKGIALAKLIYGNVEGRDFGDLDLIVKVEDLKRFGNLLVELGYFHRHDGSIHDICEVMEHEQGMVYEIKFYKFMSDGSKLVVELKKASDAIEYNSMKEFFSHKTPLYINDMIGYHTFEVNYLFLHLCSNIYTDHYKYEGVFGSVGKFRDYVDLYFFYNNHHIKDTEIYSLAKHFHLEKSIDFCKCMMKRLFGIDILAGIDIVQGEYPEAACIIDRNKKSYFWKKYIYEQKMQDKEYDGAVEAFCTQMENININLKWEKKSIMSILLKLKMNDIKNLEKYRLYLCFIAGAEKPVREEEIDLDTFYSNNQSVIVYMKEGKIYFYEDSVPLFHVLNSSMSNNRLPGREAETYVEDGNMFVCINNITVSKECRSQSVHFNAFLDVALLENYYKHNIYLYPLGTPFQKIW